MKFYTKALTSGTFTISAAQNVLSLSIKTSSSGSCSFAGDGTFNEQASETQTFGANDGITLGTDNPMSPLDGITITWISGTVNIIIGVT